MIHNELFGGVFKIDLDYHYDERGFFSEIFKENTINDLDLKFVQDNVSFSKDENTLRGLHFQDSPFDQTKFVIVLSGLIWDVFVDIRRDSKTYMKIGFTELKEGGSGLLIPKGFAHGFITLRPNTLVLYKVDNYYSKPHEKGIRWNDKVLNIPWPKLSDDIIISEKDKNLPDVSSLNNE